MKRILFITMIAIFSMSTVFAQKSALRDAKRALGKDDLGEARTLIKQAATNPETANDPETWKVMGDIGNKAFDAERVKAALGQGHNEKAMHDGLLESYLPYLKADSLSELPDEKGKVKNKVRKDVSSILRSNHPFYINGGVFYNSQKDYAKAADFFEIYWNIPTLPLYEGQKESFVLDSTYQSIKYYAIVSAITAEQHERALRMLERVASEPFIENPAFKETDVYELMAEEYKTLGDSVKFVQTLYKGAEKFPSSSYFLLNLINVFIKEGKPENALQYLDQAIANDPSNACDLNSVKGALLAEKKDYTNAEVEYKKALAHDPNCERALENLARNYMIQAQELKETTATLSRQQQVENDKKTIDYYQQALPLLENLDKILKGRSAAQQEINAILLLLRNAYYNLSVLGVDKSDQLKAIEDQLDLE